MCVAIFKILTVNILSNEEQHFQNQKFQDGQLCFLSDDSLLSFSLRPRLVQQNTESTKRRQTEKGQNHYYLINLNAVLIVLAVEICQRMLI